MYWDVMGCYGMLWDVMGCSVGCPWMFWDVVGSSGIFRGGKEGTE